MSDVRGVLFDFGNTLFAHHSLPLTIVSACRTLGSSPTSSWAEALADQITAQAQSADELRHPRDLQSVVWNERWLLLYSQADDEVPGLGEAVYAAMHDPAQWHPYVATLQVLQSLHERDVPVAIVSNTGWDVRTVFAAAGVSDTVTAFVLSCEVGVMKPSAEIFRFACAELGVAPTAVLMVGDDAMADAGAVRAGLRTLLLPAALPFASNGLEAVSRIVARD